MNNPVYLGFSMSEIIKIEMYKFQSDYVNPKYGGKAKILYMDTDSFIFQVKTEDVYKVVPKDVEKRFDTSNYQLERPLPKGKNKKVIGLIKDKLAEKIMKEFV